MTESLVELRGVLRALHERQIDYLLFGAAAMLFYGHIRATQDIDLLVAPEAENLDRVSDWLLAVHAHLALRPQRPFGARERWGLKKGSNATLLTDAGQIDIVQRLPGLDAWRELRERAEIYAVEDFEVPVLDRRTLIELKRRRGAPRDVSDIDALMLLEEDDQGGGG